LVALWEWLTLCPNIGPFPQILHTLGMDFLSKALSYTTKRPA
jgi:hypothetical protein